MACGSLNCSQAYCHFQHADGERMRPCDATDNPAELDVSEEMKEPKPLQWFFNVLGVAFHQAGIYFTVQQNQKLFMWKQLRCVLGLISHPCGSSLLAR